MYIQNSCKTLWPSVSLLSSPTTISPDSTRTESKHTTSDKQNSSQSRTKTCSPTIDFLPLVFTSTLRITEPNETEPGLSILPILMNSNDSNHQKSSHSDQKATTTTHHRIFSSQSAAGIHTEPHDHTPRKKKNPKRANRSIQRNNFTNPDTRQWHVFRFADKNSSSTFPREW